MSEYSLASYGRMVADAGRMDAYARALEQAVGPGSIVLDIGTGTGIFALLAARWGARRVYAVEPSDAIQAARDVAAASGLADQIEFVQGLSTELELPERADVVVSDIRGILPPHRDHLVTIIDARKRLLAEGGILIPHRDTMWVALVEAPDSYRANVEIWDRHSRGFDVGPLRELARNSRWREAVPATAFLTEAACWARLDYTTITQLGVSGDVHLAAARPGTAHGLCVWFDSELADGIGFSNGPDAPELIYGRSFFALTASVPVEEGDAVRVRLDARYLDGDYVWRWRTQIGDRAAYDQSTLAGVPISADSLRKKLVTHVPALNPEGRVVREALQRMGSGACLEVIAEQLQGLFPGTFPTRDHALRKVAALSRMYSL
jgi:protein arginine N-methyltransferase 1